MRPCPGCDYIVPAGWSECKRCGAALSGAPALATVHTAQTADCTRRGAHGPGRPGLAYEPPPMLPASFAVGGVSPGAADVRPSARGGARRVDLHAETAAAGPRRPKRSVGLLVALIVVGACGWFAWNKLAHPPVPAAMKPWLQRGQGVTFSPPTGGWSVSLPSAPMVRGARTVVGRATATYASIAEAPVGGHDVGVVWFTAMPSDLATEPDGPARAAADAASRAVGYRIDVPEATTDRGAPALVADITMDQGTTGKAYTVVDGNLVVTVFVAGVDQGSAGFEHLRQSLKLSSR